MGFRNKLIYTTEKKLLNTSFEILILSFIFLQSSKGDKQSIKIATITQPSTIS